MNIRFIYLTLTCIFLYSCSDDEISIWGDKQDLDGSTWAGYDTTADDIYECTGLYLDETTADIELSFNNGSYRLIVKECDHEKSDTTYTITGTYTYEHPYIHLVSEGETIEAWVNYGNYICYDGGVYSPRYHYLEKQ